MRMDVGIVLDVIKVGMLLTCMLSSLKNDHIKQRNILQQTLALPEAH